MQLVIKAGDASVKNFIFSSWIKCYQGTMEAEMMGKTKAIEQMHSFITKLFSKDIDVSYVGNDENDEVFSYIVFDKEKKIVYFGYTKSVYRKDGLFHRLMLANNILGYEFPFVFYGNVSRVLAQKYQLTYNPKIALE